MDLKDIHAVSAVSTQGAVIDKSWVSGYLSITAWMELTGLCSLTAKAKSRLGLN